MAHTLIIDIETIGESWDEMDSLTQDNLASWLKREYADESGYKAQLELLKEGLGFSPLSGQIVAIGVHDYERNRSAVYYQNESDTEETQEIDGVKYINKSEAGMLNKFWSLAQDYEVFVTFNGYAFDVPYLVVRSAVHGIRPSVNLMVNRYLSYQSRAPHQHVDLQDQLSFYGAMRKKGSLHMWTRAFKIPTPKSEGVNGHEVATMYKQKRFLDIAIYNAADIRATAELYTKWQQFMKF